MKREAPIFPDATREVRSLVALGDYVVAQGIGRGPHLGVFNSPAGVLQPTGRRMEVHFCDVYRLEDGKIIRAESYLISTACSGNWPQSASRERNGSPSAGAACAVSACPPGCSGLRTVHIGLANKGVFGPAICAIKRPLGPTLMANEPTLVCEGLANTPVGQHALRTG